MLNSDWCSKDNSVKLKEIAIDFGKNGIDGDRKKQFIEICKSMTSEFKVGQCLYYLENVLGVLNETDMQKLAKEYPELMEMKYEYEYVNGISDRNKSISNLSKEENDDVSKNKEDDDELEL